MFQNEIKFIYDFVINRIKNLGEVFTIEKLLEADIHPAIKKYIEAEIDFLIYDDRKKLLQNSIFDYTGNKIAKYFELISQEIKKSKRVNVEDIQKLVLQAVSFNANYVVRPKWSLTKLIFGNNKSISNEELSMMLKYIYYYDYLKNIIEAYLEKRKLLTISVTEFELILNKIDRELFQYDKQKLIDNSLISIADFFSIGALNRSSVTVECVENFLKEKNLIDELIKLKRVFSEDIRKPIPVDDIKKVIYSTAPIVTQEEEKSEAELSTNEELKEEEIQTSPQETEAEKSEPSSESISQEVVSDEIPEEESEEKVSEEVEQILDNIEKELESDEETDEIKPLTEKEEQELLSFYDKELKKVDEVAEETNEIDSSLKELEQEMQKALDNEIEISDEIEIEEVIEFENEGEKENIHLDITQRTDVEKPVEENEASSEDISDNKEKKTNRQKDIFSYLSKKEIDKIIDSVFNSDSEDFASTIERISECSSYEEATEILKTVFTTYKVGELSKEAVLLTNAVARYFSQD
ncbi:Hypothetical protein IALB_2296 [Ignavibacterium album JCM 16511]|uniref:Uncharacterized protein n=1 Tax=Ignavibacterium album (strain DSM 19864 / JCM 16511 / NBRC 101810 / Mat9-16) TaxID=945713 RepID=I0ALZ2_IGNAJ|nr:hypothetical protein [Ignavibacterium album]AFH49999.1 Hypothetical protein IALB_2296 [Ignavibacterium album JCM 16511]